MVILVHSTKGIDRSCAQDLGRITRSFYVQLAILHYLVDRGNLEVEGVLIPSHVILLVRSVELLAVFLTTHHPTNHQQRGHHDRFDVLHKRLRLLQLVEVEVKPPIHHLQGERIVVSVVLYQLLLEPEQSSLVLRLFIHLAPENYSLADLNHCFPSEIRGVPQTIRTHRRDLSEGHTLLSLFVYFLSLAYYNICLVFQLLLDI